jgi:hypothetical protein
VDCLVNLLKQATIGQRCTAKRKQRGTIAIPVYLVNDKLSDTANRHSKTPTTHVLCITGPCSARKSIVKLAADTDTR